MATIEQKVRSQFERVFATSDWKLFKKFAELNLRDAAKLRTANMAIENSLRLLARNSRKRLLIGLGVELLLKAIYLKHGYVINTPRDRNAPQFPILNREQLGIQLAPNRTFSLNKLIEHLPNVVQLQNKELTANGLTIAQIFRNKEGHVVTRKHAFDPANYTSIASSLVELYRDAFGERLSVRFSFAPNEPAVWRISRTSAKVRPSRGHC